MSPPAPFKPPFPPNPPPGAPKPPKAPAPEPKPEPKPEPEKKERPKVRKPPDFMPILRKKPVTLHLVNGVEISGIMTGYNNYEIAILVDETHELLVLKHAVLFITPPEGWRKLPNLTESEEEEEEPAPAEPEPAEG